jgi:hypothetical protein
MVLFNYDQVFDLNKDYSTSDYEFNNNTKELTIRLDMDIESVQLFDKVDIFADNSIISPNFSPVYEGNAFVADKSVVGDKVQLKIQLPFNTQIVPLLGSLFIPSIRFPKRITYTFSEPLNSWVSELSLRPNWIDELNIGTISIDNGVPYKNDDSETRNTFLGDSYQSEVELVCNENPSYPKRFKTIQQESNKKWTVEIETNTPSGENRTLFQKSDLTEANLKHISNMFVGGFWKDINTVNVQNPKFEGNDMRGQFAKIKLQNNSTEKLETFSVGVNYIATNASNEE